MTQLWSFHRDCFCRWMTISVLWEKSDWKASDTTDFTYFTDNTATSYGCCQNFFKKFHKPVRARHQNLLLTSLVPSSVDMFAIALFGLSVFVSSSWKTPDFLPLFVFPPYIPHSHTAVWMSNPFLLCCCSWCCWCFFFLFLYCDIFITKKVGDVTWMCVCVCVCVCRGGWLV